MEFDLSQLAALSAAVAEGTFDGAARALHVTPSAISQRLKALEMATGRVLLVRSKPIQVTESGRSVLRLARQVAALAGDTARELGTDDGSGPMTIPLAVNSDSLATWVLPALEPLSGEVCFDLQREDQERTSDLLREGSVMAAITSEARPIPGCSSTPLGAMRYRFMVAPSFAARWFPEGLTSQALERAPVVVFDRHDDLQHRYLRRRSRRPLAPPMHYVPSTADFLHAVHLGFGWGMVPDLQLTGSDRTGQLRDLDPQRPTDVPLHWQQWKLHSRSLDLVAEAVVSAGRAHLQQPRSRAAKR